MIVKIMKEVKGIDVTTPFPRIPYDEAMGAYGSDKPDTRFELKLVDLTEAFKNSSFKVFVGDCRRCIMSINVKGVIQYSRKDIDGITEYELVMVQRVLLG